MVSSFVISFAFFVAGKIGAAVPAHIALLITVGATTIVWIAVTLATPPSDRATLVHFYRLVRPAGRGWEPVREEAGVGASPDSIPQMLLAWTAGCVFVYAALFGAGNIIRGSSAVSAVFVAAAVASGVVLWRLMATMFASSPSSRA
jgi:hypothetical protein